MRSLRSHVQHMPSVDDQVNAATIIVQMSLTQPPVLSVTVRLYSNTEPQAQTLGGPYSNTVLKT